MGSSVLQKHYFMKLIIFPTFSQYLFFSGVTLLFEHSPSQASEIEHFDIFSHLRENQLAQQFFEKFNLLFFVLIS